MPASSEDLDPAQTERQGGISREENRPTVVGMGDLAAAEEALGKAEDAYEAAQDALADLEGELAVLDSRDTAGERQEAAEAKFADLESTVTVLTEKAAAQATSEPWQQTAAREDLAKAQRALELAKNQHARNEELHERKEREERAKVQRAFMRAGRGLSRAETTRDAAAERVAAERDLALRADAVSPDGAGEAPPAPRFATVDLFVERFVLPNWVHLYDDARMRWCAMWWEHAEAITRLEALWEAFEVMRLEPAPSFSTWLRDHFDVHMRTLTDAEGVFVRCDVEKRAHEVRDPWPHEPAPEGMFATIESAQIQRDLARTPNASPSGEATSQGGLSALGGIKNHTTQHSGAIR